MGSHGGYIPAAALFLHFQICLVCCAAYFVALWALVGICKAVAMPGLRWQSTGSKWLGSIKIARSDLVGLWLETKQSTALSQAVMVTTNGADTVHLFFLAGGSSFSWSNRFWLGSSSGVSVWNFLIPAFLASMGCVNGSCWEQLAFLLGPCPRRREMIGWAVGLNFKYLFPSLVKDEVLWDGHCLLLLVLNCNGLLDGNHAWNNLVIVYRGAWHKGLGNFAAQYMKW